VVVSYISLDGIIVPSDSPSKPPVQFSGSTILGAFWGGIWGLLFGSAFFLIPGIGPLLVAGPLVSWIVGALEGAVVVGGLSAIGAGLYSLGIPKDSILRYETALRTGKFIVIAHGSSAETAQAQQIIKSTNPERLEEHQPSRVNPEPCLASA
jgi:uncharacterized membrane protein